MPARSRLGRRSPAPPPGVAARPTLPPLLGSQRPLKGRGTRLGHRLEPRESSTKSFRTQNVLDKRGFLGVHGLNSRAIGHSAAMRDLEAPTSCLTGAYGASSQLRRCISQLKAGASRHLPVLVRHLDLPILRIRWRRLRPKDLDL